MRADQKRNIEHMERVRAVHRRSAYERAVRHIARLERLRILSKQGLRPFYPFEAEELEHLRTLRDANTRGDGRGWTGRGVKLRNPIDRRWAFISPRRAGTAFAAVSPLTASEPATACATGAAFRRQK